MIPWLYLIFKKADQLTMKQASSTCPMMKHFYIKIGLSIDKINNLCYNDSISTLRE